MPTRMSGVLPQRRCGAVPSRTPRWRCCSLRMVSGPDREKRQLAAYALQGGPVRDTSAALLLVQMMSNPDRETRQLAASVLQGGPILDRSVAALLTQMLNSSDPEERQLAARALHGGSPRA